MDDLWGNAWGSPEDDAKPTTWKISEKPRNDDIQEDDLAMPSWSTGPGIRWDEPSDTHASLWSNSNVHHTAQDRPLENSFDDIPLGNSRLTEPQGDDNSTVDLPVEPESHSFSPPSPRAQRDDITALSLSREPDHESTPSPKPSSPSPSPSPEPSPSSSPDAFGTFTIGAEHSDTAPFPTPGEPLGGQIDDNEWGSPWGSVSKDVEEGSAQVANDEWESAKRRQLEMDRQVPPELLSQIFHHLEELSKDAWPETQDVAEEDWQRRCSGMDVDGLDSLLLRYVPVLTLPRLLPSGKSFTAKAMADAVKLSRNTALACTSPMSTLLAAKGSTAWETSVKSRTEIPVDEVPSGWRILEKDPKKDEKAGDTVKKPTGLLASFWSRKTSSLPSTPPSQEPSSPSPEATASENAHPVQTLIKRSSVESVKISPVTVTTPQTPPQPSPAPASIQDEDTNVPPPGSAVSRFLQRFSRPRLSSPSPRNSLALSGDDLEYLSDVRSNSTDLVDIGDGLTGLGTIGTTESSESGFLRGKLPPPLPPPPKVPAPAPSNNTLNGHSLISTNDPHLKTTSDPRKQPEDSTVSALTLLTPSPLNSPKLKSIPPNPAPSHPLSSDRIAPPIIIPVSSSRPNSVMGTLPVAQPQLQTSGNSTKPFDISQDDDDDFSDFRSSPADPPILPLNFGSPVTRQGKVGSTQSSQRQLNSPFDDLVHLMSSPTTGPPNTFEAPKALQPLNFANPVLPTAPTPPLPSVSTQRASLDYSNATPTHSRSNSQQSTSPSKVAPTSPKQKAITQGHQRTQSLLDLAATRRGRWPAPPSPLPEPLQPPPPPPGKGQVEGPTNADYFGFTPTKDSFNLPSPAPPGKTSTPLSSPQADTSSKDPFSAPNLFGASPQPGPFSGPPPLLAPTPHTGTSARRTLSPPPLPTAIMNKLPSKSHTPVPLLPPPSGFRVASPVKAPPAPPAPQIVPEPSPLALLMGSDGGKNVNLPDMKAKATPPPRSSVKGTGGLSAQDLSFFEGL